MDKDLDAILQKLELQNDVLGFVREKHLELEATRKHYEAKLINEAAGKSHAEKVTNAHASDAYKTLVSAVAKVEADYEFELLKFKILDKEFLALYLCLKSNHETRKG